MLNPLADFPEAATGHPCQQSYKGCSNQKQKGQAPVKIEEIPKITHDGKTLAEQYFDGVCRSSSDLRDVIRQLCDEVARTILIIVGTRQCQEPIEHFDSQCKNHLIGGEGDVIGA